MRVGKLYHDEMSPEVTIKTLGEVSFGSAGQLFDAAYRYPSAFGLSLPEPFTIGTVIWTLTGYQVVHHRTLDHADGRRIRPAYDSAFTRWYYRRDVVGLLLPRARCSVCGQKVRREVRCTRRCLRFQSSLAYAHLTSRENSKWWEHKLEPVCSPDCHRRVEDRSRHLTMDLLRTRQWLEESKQLLAQVESLLPGKKPRRRVPPQRASRSPGKESGRLTISETS